MIRFDQSCIPGRNSWQILLQEPIRPGIWRCTNILRPAGLTLGLREALYQRIHDHAMDDALRRFLAFDDQGMTRKKGVGIMGGHSTKRTDLFYLKTAQTARLLCAEGYLVVSGGGPGIMEAANLGAYFGNRSAKDLEDAIGHLAASPHYSHPDFNKLAAEVLEQYPGWA